VAIEKYLYCAKTKSSRGPGNMKFAELHANEVSTEFPDFSCRQVVQLCLIYTIEPSKIQSARLDG
jgi:hypothetical protein